MGYKITGFLITATPCTGVRVISIREKGTGKIKMTVHQQIYVKHEMKAMTKQKYKTHFINHVNKTIFILSKSIS